MTAKRLPHKQASHSTFCWLNRISPMNHWLRWWCGTLVTTRLKNESMNSQIPLGVALKIILFGPLKIPYRLSYQQKDHHIASCYPRHSLGESPWKNPPVDLEIPPSLPGDFHPRPGGFGESLPASSGGTHFVWQGKLRIHHENDDGKRAEWFVIWGWVIWVILQDIHPSWEAESPKWNPFLK